MQEKLTGFRFLYNFVDEKSVKQLTCLSSRSFYAPTLNLLMFGLKYPKDLN